MTTAGTKKIFISDIHMGDARSLWQDLTLMAGSGAIFLIWQTFLNEQLSAPECGGAGDSG